MITKIESTRGAMAPTSLMKYRLLNQITIIKIASMILINSRGTSTNAFVNTMKLQTIMKKSVMLQILVRASFPKVYVYK